MNGKCAGPSGLLARVCAVLLLTGCAGTAIAQDVNVLTRARALYAEAAYEQALTLLGTEDSPEAHQYRALCLMALGRAADAEKAMEALVTRAPLFTADAADVPPRFVSLLTSTRQRVLPDVVRQTFSDARAHFQSKALHEARRGFEEVMTLLKDPAMREAADTADLQVLTAGYLDLMTNTPAPTPALVPASRPVPAVDAPSLDAPPAAAASQPATPPAARPVVIIPPRTIRQNIPAYTGAPVSGQATGAVRITIGRDGRVSSAQIETSIDPRYDARLLNAARSWEYEPARRDGLPIEYEKTVQINVLEP